MNRLRPYQEEGRDFLVARRTALLADVPGLGKTAQAICAARRLNDPLKFSNERILVVCPANLRINWLREFETWWPGALVSIADDSFPLTGDVVVVSYNGLKKFYKELRTARWAIVICDEADALQTLDSQRTINLRGGWGTKPIPCQIKWALTGTPFRNRPFNLYPILKWLECDFALKEEQFGMRYCYKGKDHSGRPDFRGAINKEELREKLSSIMLRRTKAQVLKELPQKQVQVIELCHGTEGEVARREEQKDAGPTNLFRLDLSDKGLVARCRNRAGLTKFTAAVKHIRSLLEKEEKVVVFAWHHEVIAALDTALDEYKPTLLTGLTPKGERQYAVDDFQLNPETRLFIGNLSAAGVGLTLTAASYVVFVEFDWTPGANQQAEDRLHRIGQERTVIVQYLVLADSLDAIMARSNQRKQEILDEVLA